MIIDRNASVTPNRYEAPWLRRTIGKRIGRANRDDLLSAFVWVAGVRLAEELTGEWREFCFQLDRELRDAEQRQSVLRWRLDDQVADLCHTYSSKVADALGDEHFWAEQSLSQCEQIAHELSGRLGLKLGDEYEACRDTHLSLGILSAQLETARQRVDKVMGRYRRKSHALAEVEELQQRDAAAPTLTQLDAMTPDQFDEVIREALERSGFRTKSCGPRLTEISREDETRLVYSDHVQDPKADETTDLRSMVRAQRAAEASGFDAVLTITNLKYISHPAQRHIENTAPTVHLVQRRELQRWVQWEMPLENKGIQ
ncbi:hypothetical protein ACIF6I_33405 [Streptomyces microflavus]|uniref:hypothetical protein n=1 Tax=Streptomyces microflavus TaxID=1919 RepID=UPI0037D71515